MTFYGYVYALIDPVSRQVIYIGKTRNLRKTLNRHNRSKVYLKELCRRGYQVEIVPLEKIYTRNPSIDMREQWYIGTFLMLGEPLLNKCRYTQFRQTLS